MVRVVLPSCGGVSSAVFKICQAMKSRFKTITNRRPGAMRDSHALVQHLNPACRAARLFPQLPLSRLMISLNDFDVARVEVGTGLGTDLIDVVHLGMRDAYRPPSSADGLEPYEYVLEKLLQLLVAAVVRAKCALLLALTSLPYPVQDALLEMSGILCVNLLALSFYLLGRVVMGLAIVLALLLLLGLYLKETTSWRKTELYRIVRDTAPSLVRNLPVFKQRKKYEESTTDFDSRVLFKSNFVPVDSEITRTESIYDRRRNKYAAGRNAKTKTQLVQPLDKGKDEEDHHQHQHQDQMRGSPQLVVKPPVSPSKDLQKQLSLYAPPSANKAPDREPPPSKPHAEEDRLNQVERAFVVEDRKEREQEEKEKDESARRREKGRSSNGRRRGKGSDRERKEDDSEDGEERRRAKAAAKSKKRLHRLSQEIAALQLQAGAEVSGRGREKDLDEDSENQSLASMSARSRQPDQAESGPSRHRRRKERERLEGSVSISSGGPGEGPSAQQQLHQRLQLQLQQRAVAGAGSVVSQSRSTITGLSPAPQPAGAGGMSMAGPGFGASGSTAGLRFNNSFDPLAASAQFQQQQHQHNPSANTFGQSTRSQFPSWH